jgi:CRISPR-associated protein Csc3
MSRKSKKNDNTQQLSFFDLEQNNQTDVDHLKDYDEEFEASSDFELGDLSPELLGLDSDDSSRIVEEHRELLTLKLLRKAIQAKNIDDPVMFDFAEYVLPNLLKLTIGVTAKGGGSTRPVR